MPRSASDSQPVIESGSAVRDPVVQSRGARPLASRVAELSVDVTTRSVEGCVATVLAAGLHRVEDGLRCTEVMDLGITICLGLGDMGEPLVARAEVEGTRAAQAQTTVFDAQGEFRLEGLPPGIYDVVGGAADHALTRVRDVEMGTAEVVVALVLPEGGRISGRVIDASTGEPLALARVEVERSLAAGASITPMRSSALTDDAGAFEIHGVEPGRCSVYAYALDYAPRAISGLEVEAGADAGPVEVALRPAADAAGEVFDIVGIGVMVQVDGETLRVSAVIEDGGADRAGIVVGDLLLEIDGIPVVGLVDFGGAVQALRGREGTEVRLGVAREGVEPFEVTAVRARVRG